MAWRIAQLVQRPTEKPGAILTSVRVPSAARIFFSQSQCSVQTLLLFSYSPCVTVLKYACINFCAALYKPQTLGYIQMAIPLFGHTKILQTLIGMGSAALAAAVPYPGEATRISSKGQ